jgi:hypothetical protein
MIVEGLNWTNTIISWFLLLWIYFYLKPKLFNGVKMFNDEHINVKSYSVFVRGLPSGATRVLFKF